MTRADYRLTWFIILFLSALEGTVALRFSSIYSAICSGILLRLAVRIRKATPE